MKNYRSLFLSMTTAAFTAAMFGCQSNSEQAAATQSEEGNSVAVAATKASDDNTLTAQEKQEGWELLFDGQETSRWRGANQENFPEKGWKVEDGVLMVLESGGGESQHGGDIVTKDEYANFHLKVDFKLTEGANSGIKYFVTENYASQGSAIGLEYQILDDERHPDAKLGNNGTGTRTASSLYDLMAASNKKMRPIGEWNSAEIVVQGTHVEHWLNGEKVLEYERGSEQYQQLVAQSKYKNYENFGLAEEGHLLLQDHGNRVYFKNIKIKELPNS